MVAPLTFPRTHRLAHNREFDAVFAAKLRRTRGPLTFHSLRNTMGHYRLGLSVGKAVGGATVRNRFKRLIREAFRLRQHELPLSAEAGLDIVVSVRAHKAKSLEDYAAMLLSAAGDLAAEWERRERGTPR
ncbi:MAG: ribonuclease P protein component [Phycisphaerales bacterium]